MNYFLLILINILKLTSLRSTVYLCADSSYADEQCLTHEKKGDVDFMWVRKCKGAKVCLLLPYYNQMIGACNIKVRTHYDRESCFNNNKCTSGICDGTKCKGFTEEQECILGLAQCEKGLVCRYKENSDFTSCLPPVNAGEKCIMPSFNEMSIKDDKFSIYGSYNSYFVPWYNPCQKNQVCNTTKNSSSDKKQRLNGTCLGISSFNNDQYASNPLLCSSGFIDKENKCIEPDEDKNTQCQIYHEENKSGDFGCMYTSKGSPWKISNKVKNAFTAWWEECDKDKKDNEDLILEAYRYTKNKKKINELFFRYTHYGWMVDADECAYDYMWKNNKDEWIKISYFIFILVLLI